MTLHEFGLLLVSVLTAVGGQFFLKTGALKLGKVNASNVVSHILGILTTPELLIGLTLYGLSAVLYILLLTRVKLSVVGPAVSIGYIFSVLLGYFVFRESIPFSRLVGLGLIACGVILVVLRD
ncbi:EamA family transporter [Leptolyngbya sp. FACHB-36]|uniref:EamA family transporter n=1 Tax=Leptolyngbya sp. FACHB-36 TaxID=2692808 RepID=UPI0016810D7B|nr:EamA family transporter [Leptolyngbya sp. FACHB-36]